MKILKLTSQFKKDLKRYKHKTEVINKLETIRQTCAFRNSFRTVLRMDINTM